MEKNRKSYMAAMKMEVITEDDKTVKAVRVHGLRTVDDFPVEIFCGFMEALGRMTPGEPVMLVQNKE